MLYKIPIEPRGEYQIILLGNNESLNRARARTNSKGKLPGMAHTQNYGSKTKLEKLAKPEDNNSQSKDSPKASPTRIVKTYRTHGSNEDQEISSTIGVEGGPLST